VYVWFDALLNYVSAVGYGVSDKFDLYWPADLHVVGKDILRQHAVYWPIMLRALEIECPKKVLAHGWWTMGGEKVSKSRGNIVDPVEIIAKYGVDTFRYFLLREVTLGFDGSYSEDLLHERFTNDLGNDLGNLVHRSFAMLKKYFDGKIPEGIVLSDLNNKLRETGSDLWSKVDCAMEELDPRGAIEEIWNLIREANRFVEENKPWALAKDPSKRDTLASVLYSLMETIRVIGVVLTPFLPQAAGKILRQLNLEGVPCAKELETWGCLEPGTPVGVSEPLFPRIEDDPES